MKNKNNMQLQDIHALITLEDGKEVYIDGNLIEQSECIVLDGQLTIEDEIYLITGSSGINQKWEPCWTGKLGDYSNWKGQLIYNDPIGVKMKKYADYENAIIETESPIKDIEKLKEVFLHANFV